VFVKIKRSDVAALLEQGLTVGQVARRLDVAPATVCYHARRLGYPPSQKYARRYDWAEIQAYYELRHSVRECRARFGFSTRSWNDAVKRGDVQPRPQETPIAELLERGVRRGRWNIKRRLIAAGLKEARCEECGISEWRGKSLELDLHHRNGDRNDNRLENLALLCPNCHRQTDTFGVRNRRAA
jgi:5-methylcytosine-specific restriction endonuclease McrA